jgi:uncharacterized protein YjbI with pentapeptide repeats
MNESDNASPLPDPDDRVAHHELPELKIHGYRVCEILSEHYGGARITYLAEDPNNFDRLVVVKEWRNLDGELSSCDYANYLPEIERLQQLNHPNLSRYLNSFPTPTGFCVVREYRSGVSLAEIGKLPPADIILVAEAVLKLLGVLHQLEPIVIHKNIKPENIIVNTEQKLTICLVDFGLYPHNTDLEIATTPGFTPPEQLFDLELTSAADIYSLGVSLICLLTGTATSQAQSLLDDRYRPQFKHLLPDDIDPQLIDWLEQMVEPDRQQRYLNATLDRYPGTTKSPRQSQKSPQAKPASNTSKPKPKIWWLPWGIGLLTLLGLGIFLRQLLTPDSEELSPAQIAKNLEIAKQAEFAASARGRLIRENRCVGCNLDRQNFAKAELTGANLPQSTLNGANFSNANLTLAIFRDADLSGANFSKANLHQAAFYGAKLIGTNLVGANLSNAKLVYAKLDRALLKDANLANADLKFAEFQQVDLRNANLTGADLSNADLSYANLLKAKLNGAKLDGVNFKGAIMPNGSTHP